MNLFFKITVLVFLNGLSAMICQIILFKEILSQIYANELILGIMFAFWFTAGAFSGTFVYKKLLPELSKKNLYFIAFLPVINSVLPLLMVLFIRYFKFILKIPVEVMVNIWDAAIISSIVFIPVSLFLTFNFSAIYNYLKNQNLNNYAGFLYIFEATGAITIGIIFTLFLSGETSNLITLYWIGIINIAAVYIIFREKDIQGKIIQVILSFILILYLVPLFTNFLEKIDKESEIVNYSKYDVLKNKELKTGKVIITGFNDIKSIFFNGNLHYVIDDLKYKEIIGWAILSSNRNENVLLINAGYAGCLKELKKYKSIKSIDYIENDNEEAKFIENYFGKLNYDNVNYYYGDAIYYLSKNKINKKFDVVILNADYPSTLFSARYFTREFFNLLKNYIVDDGLLIFSIRAGENFIDKKIYPVLVSVYKAAEKNFKNINLVPGDNLYFLCSNKDINLKPELVLQKLKKENVENPLFNKKYVEYMLEKEKIQNIKNKLQANYRTNNVFAPFACFYSIRSDLFMFKNSQNILKVLFLLLLFVILLKYIFNPDEFKINKRNYIAMFLISFVGIMLEILAIFIFQNIYGYFYQLIGILFAVFMFGIIAGCLISYINNFRLNFIISLNVLIIFSFIVYLLSFIKDIYQINFFVIVFIIICAGVLTGSSYNFLIKKTDASFLYGIDMLGGAAGSFFVSILILPVAGVIFSLLLCSIILILVLFLNV